MLGVGHDMFISSNAPYSSKFWNGEPHGQRHEQLNRGPNRASIDEKRENFWIRPFTGRPKESLRQSHKPPFTILQRSMASEQRCSTQSITPARDPVRARINGFHMYTSRADSRESCCPWSRSTSSPVGFQLETNHVLLTPISMTISSLSQPRSVDCLRAASCTEVRGTRWTEANYSERP
jgi:hypothetical protein